MPLDARCVGESTEAVTHEVDARWLMAYAAALGDFDPRYFDTAAGTVIGHPLFPVCLEWPAILAARRLPGHEAVTPAESARGVHAAHDMHIYRPIRAGDRLHTRATIIALETIRPGAAMTIRLDTVDDAGALVCRTYYLAISRGVAVIGGDRFVEHVPPVPHAVLGVQAEVDGPPIEVGTGLAHVYTECARIFNPIHTDRAVALAAGLPDVILHGTASLALTVSRLVETHLGGDPERVRRIGGRFSAMVLMPSTLWLAVDSRERGELGFELRRGDGQPAISRGFLCWE